jgi:phosphoribosylglycinamide formyltransferase 1
VSRVNAGDVMALARITVLISGRGSNLAALIDAADAGQIDGAITHVISNRPQAPGLDFARRHGIATKVVDHRAFASRDAFDDALADAIDQGEPDLVVLAGFMRILDPSVLAPWVGRMINIHPSLLPKYRGLKTHERAITAGDAMHGASVHFVTPELDGGPVISQIGIPIEAGDTPALLSTRLLPLEHRLLAATVNLIAQHRVALVGDSVHFDGRTLAAPLRLAGRTLAA